MEKFLFEFIPQGHGSNIFVCIAENEEEAYNIIDSHIQQEFTSYAGHLVYEAQGWGTDYYKCNMQPLNKILSYETS